MTGSRHRVMRGVVFGAVITVAAASCTQGGWLGRRTTTTRSPATTRTTIRTTTTTGDGHNHGNHQPRLDHPPTEEQKAAALRFVDETRAVINPQNLTVAKIVADHYVPIGDTVHYVKPEYVFDDKELDPHAPEAFTVIGGRVAAVMYINAGDTMDDVPDIAGNWTIWHDHLLSYQSDDPTTDEYFKLGFGPGSYQRRDSPMIHVWLQPNRCGPFAGAGVGEGSCIEELATY